MRLFADKVKRLRNENGWTQEQLSEIAGLNRRTIQRIEKDGRCSYDSQMAVASAFSLQLKDLKKDHAIYISPLADSFFIQDSKGLYKAAHINNPDLFFVPQHSMVGRNASKVLPKQFSDDSLKAIAQLNNGQEQSEFIYELETPEGIKYFNVRMLKSGIDDYLSIVTDVSKKEIKEQKSRRNDALLSTVADTLKAGGWEMEVPSLDKIWTEQVKNIYETDALLPFSEVRQMYECKSRSTVEGALENLLEFGTFYDLDLQLTTGKGNSRWIRLTGNSLFENDKVVKVWGMVQDITQIKQSAYEHSSLNDR